MNSGQVPYLPGATVSLCVMWGFIHLQGQSPMSDRICAKGPCGVWFTTGIQEMLLPLFLVALPSPASTTLDGIGRIFKQSYWLSSHPGKEAQVIITPQTISSSYNNQGKDTYQEVKIGLVIEMGPGDQSCRALSVPMIQLAWYSRVFAEPERDREVAGQSPDLLKKNG